MFGELYHRAYQTPISLFLARYLIIGLLLVPSALFFALIPWTAPLAILIVFKTLLPSLAGAFAVFGFSHYFFIRFKLLNEDKSD